MFRTCRVDQLEKTMNLAGDDLLPAAKIKSTHGVAIGASVDQVWPWVVQIGQGRGGFYSYSTLENLIGCEIKNADRIHPEWQQLKVGDQIAIHPRVQALNVALVDHPNHLVLIQTKPLSWSWSFNLIAKGDSSCRLLVRTRVGWKPGLSRFFFGPFMKMGHFIMERKMLLGIRQRAEMTR